MSYYKDIVNYLSTLYPSTNIYVISDHHFFHRNIIEYERSEFDSVESMNNFIINKHNTTVSPNDIVIFLGDFSFKRNEISDILSRMNGHKFLILGNHDSSSLTKNYKALGFEGVFSEPIKFGDNYLSHYSLDSSESPNPNHYKLLSKEFVKNEEGINYHGHVHNGKSDQTHINTSCETLNYEPLYIGKTKSKVDTQKQKLLLNSSDLQRVVNILKKEKNLTSSLVISDYIYSLMLEANNEKYLSCFACGSFPQYKKYGYISAFSDLDLGVIYDETQSKKRNGERLKKVADNIYSSLIDVEGIDLEIIKRYINMCAFKYSFSNGHGLVATGALDANIVPINPYRESDFIDVTDTSSIEKYAYKYYPDMMDSYHMPKYNAKYMSSLSDISNLLLQLVFQNGFTYKKEIIIKKISHILKYIDQKGEKIDLSLEDIISRFFLRNIVFFSTLRRTREIDYIRNKKVETDFSFLGNELKCMLDEIFKSDASEFGRVFSDIKETKNDEIDERCKSLIKELK